MVFSDTPFLYAFLPLTVIFCLIVPRRSLKNYVLLVFSLLFYSWGEPKLLFLMIGAALAAYLCGLGMAYCPQRKKVFLLVSVVLLLGNLTVFKYLNFLVDNLNALTGLSLAVRTITLPIGISFYTFQILSYVIDLYRGRVGVQHNFFYFLLYVSFFPQLIAGPIVRYQTVEEEIGSRQESWDDVLYGLRRFILGLAKKVLIANHVARIAELIYGAGDAAGTAAYWLAALCYTLQIYFDFSGYSDMAIGLGRMFGFHFLENFDYPYISRSVTEFWRRWHISLSTWFRDYVYIPLGGNRVSRGRWICNILIVWGLTGLWHGAQWNFILWGLYYAVLLLIEKLFLSRFLEKLPRAVQWLYTMLLVIVGWVLFDLTDFAQLRHALAVMFTPHATDWLAVLAQDTSIIVPVLFLPFAVLFSFPVLSRWKKHTDDTALSSLGTNICCLALLVLSIVFIISSSYNPFIYFRF